MYVLRTGLHNAGSYLQAARSHQGSAIVRNRQRRREVEGGLDRLGWWMGEWEVVVGWEWGGGLLANTLTETI